MSAQAPVPSPKTPAAAAPKTPPAPKPPAAVKPKPPVEVKPPAAAAPTQGFDKVVLSVGDEKMTVGEFEKFVDALPEQCRLATFAIWVLRGPLLPDDDDGPSDDQGGGASSASAGTGPAGCDTSAK